MNQSIQIGQDFRTKTAPYSTPGAKADVAFKSLLDSAVTQTTPTTQTSADDRTASSGLHFIGTISASKPTVSHVMLSNPEFKDSGWQIIFSELNKAKDYTSIPVGSNIYYDKANGELSWSDKRQSDSPKAGNSPLLNTSSIAYIDNRNGVHDSENLLETTSPDKVSLGRVDAFSPTVSHLLAASDKFSSQKWNILAESVNKAKDFNTIPDNTEIWLDPNTMELSWESSDSSNQANLASSFAKFNLQNYADSSALQSTSVQHIEAAYQKTIYITSKDNPSPESSQASTKFPLDLTEAVKPLMGRSYKEIDCYGLLINGLKKMGLPYSGKDGLRNKLTTMAKEKGLPANAFLTGEGVVEATGRQVFTHTSTEISNWTEEAEKIFQDMKQLLQKGQILSFSTPTRGHTGIISQHNDQWTFINSGRMDNHVSEATSPKEVGEEDLLNEVHNWFKLAKKNQEPLLVTLGQIETDKIRSTFQPNFQLSQRI